MIELVGDQLDIMEVWQPGLTAEMLDLECGSSTRKVECSFEEGLCALFDFHPPYIGRIFADGAIRRKPAHPSRVENALAPP